MRDINLTILTGTISTTPTWLGLANGKRALIFTLKNQEHYRLSSGQAAVHENDIIIEVLGKNAEKYFEEFRIYQRCQINGYLRVDQGRTRVRAFRIEDMSGDG